MAEPALPRQPFRHLGKTERAASLEKARAEVRRRGELTVFGYGSLLWRPCFEAAATSPATLDGFERRFCIWTVEARGSVADPGLGLGLVPSPSSHCGGYLLRVAPHDIDGALNALWDREMLTGIYRPQWVRPRTNGESVPALAFVTDASHPQYAGELDTERAATLIARASGVLGSNRDYLDATVAALAAHGLEDAALSALARRVQAMGLGKR